MDDPLMFPGQALEKAAADTLSAAGKELTRALGKRFRAWLSKRSAKDQEAAKDISHSAELARSEAEIDARRKQQILEIRHQADMMLAVRQVNSDLIDRGFFRIRDEIEAGQRSVEDTANTALKLLDADPERDNSRSIDDDWLMRFFKYAAEVTEDQVRAVLARALADAAVKSRPIISPRALDLCRFFDNGSFKIFLKISQHIARFGALPRYYFHSHPQAVGLAIHLSLLEEMGLIKKEDQKYYTIDIGDFIATLCYRNTEPFQFSLIKLTQVGKEISGLWNQTMRALHLATQLGDIHLKTWRLQRALGIATPEAKALAVSLISDISDTWGLDIDGFIRQPEGNERLFETFRSAQTDPIRFPMQEALQRFSGENRQLIDAFVSEIEYFNERQLPSLHIKQ